MPKLPRGIGVPPRCSNFAILSRRLLRTVLTWADEAPAGGAKLLLGTPLFNRCNAAMRSLRFVCGEPLEVEVVLALFYHVRYVAVEDNNNSAHILHATLHCVKKR